MSFLLKEDASFVLQESGSKIILVDESPSVSLNTPADAATGQSTTPTLNFTGTDPESQAVEYNVQVDTVNTFDSTSGAIISHASDNSSTNGIQGGTAGSGESSQALGQSITPSVPLYLTSISFKLYSNGSPLDNVFVSVHETSPTGTTLGTSNNVAGNTIAGFPGTVVSFTFSTPIHLTGLTKYYFNIERSGARDTTNYYTGRTTNDSSYSGGNYTSRGNNTWTDSSTTNDFYFVLYGTYPLLDKFSTSNVGFSGTSSGNNITIANLTKGGDAVGGTSIATASISPSAGKLVLALVATRRGDSIEPSQPTISGCNLTWVAIDSIYYDTTGTSRRKLTLFRAMGDSPTTGTLTITFGGDTVTNSDWIIDQVTGADSSGTNGSGAIVQSITGKDESITTSSFGVTLAAFADSKNATYGGMSSADSSHTISPGSGFTELAEQADASGMVIQTEYVSSNDTSVDWLASGSVQAGGIAIEIKSGHPFTSASATDYVVQTALSAGTTYYWRVAAIDPSGSNAYGAWSSIYSFTTASGTTTSTSTTSSSTSTSTSTTSSSSSTSTTSSSSSTSTTSSSSSTSTTSSSSSTSTTSSSSSTSTTSSSSSTSTTSSSSSTSTTSSSSSTSTSTTSSSSSTSTTSSSSSTSTTSSSSSTSTTSSSTSTSTTSSSSSTSTTSSSSSTSTTSSSSSTSTTSSSSSTSTTSSSSSTSTTSSSSSTSTSTSTTSSSSSTSTSTTSSSSSTSTTSSSSSTSTSTTSSSSSSTSTSTTSSSSSTSTTSSSTSTTSSSSSTSTTSSSSSTSTSTTSSSSSTSTTSSSSSTSTSTTSSSSSTSTSTTSSSSSTSTTSSSSSTSTTSSSTSTTSTSSSSSTSTTTTLPLERYWVGGTGDWSDGANHWAITSGGSPNVSYTPTSTENVFFDTNSGLSGSTITLDVEAYVHDFTAVSGVGTFILDRGAGLDMHVYGSLAFDPSITVQVDIQFESVDTGETIFSSQVVIDGNVTFVGTGDWTLTDDLFTTDYFHQNAGTFYSANYSLEAERFNINGSAGTTNIFLGSGTWNISGNSTNCWLIDEAGGTVNVDYGTSSVIRFNGVGGTPAFRGGGKDYFEVQFNGTANETYEIYGSNTFERLTVNNPPHTIKFKEGTTQTVYSQFNFVGTAGNLITIDSIDGATQHTLQGSATDFFCDYLDISNSNATVTNWYAGTNSFDTTNNDGWIFTTTTTSTSTTSSSSSTSTTSSSSSSTSTTSSSSSTSTTSSSTSTTSTSSSTSTTTSTSTTSSSTSTTSSSTSTSTTSSSSSTSTTSSSSSTSTTSSSTSTTSSSSSTSTSTTSSSTSTTSSSTSTTSTSTSTSSSTSTSTLFYKPENFDVDKIRHHHDVSHEHKYFGIWEDTKKGEVKKDTYGFEVDKNKPN